MDLNCHKGESFDCVVVVSNKFRYSLRAEISFYSFLPSFSVTHMCIIVASVYFFEAVRPVVCMNEKMLQ